MTASVLRQAERACEKAEQRAIAARAALSKSAVKDGRLMGLLGSTDPRRVQYEAATRAAFDAERELTQAREVLEKARRSNGFAAPDRKGARAELSEALADEKRTVAAIGKNQRAIENARRMVTQAEQRAEQAGAVVEKARRRDAQAAAQAAAGSDTAPASVHVPKARAAQEAAADQLEAARSARAALGQKEGELEVALRKAREGVGQAIDAVLRAELGLPRILAEAAKLQAALTSKRLLLRLVIWERLVNKDDELREAILQLLRTPLPGPVGESGSELAVWSEHPSAVALGELRKRLAAGADAAVSV
jgi:hypothetical protein